MTETQNETTDAPAKKAQKKSGGLNTMLLADLKSLAGGPVSYTHLTLPTILRV